MKVPIIDPIKFCNTLWPNVRFYKEQKEIIYSVHENYETVVPAGNMLGKDFVSAFICLWFFMSRHPVRIVTTSADFGQLKSVLWGEITNFIQTSKYPLYHDRGGPLLVHSDLNIYKMVEDKTRKDGRKKRCGLSYLSGRVAKKGEGMLGHHVTKEDVYSEGEVIDDGIPRTFFLADEASGIDDITFTNAATWAKRVLIIGNPYPCSNYFYRAVMEGSILDKSVS
jgi:hypothetical protein